MAGSDRVTSPSRAADRETLPPEMEEAVRYACACSGCIAGRCESCLTCHNLRALALKVQQIERERAAKVARTIRMRADESYADDCCLNFADELAAEIERGR